MWQPTRPRNLLPQGSGGTEGRERDGLLSHSDWHVLVRGSRINPVIVAVCHERVSAWQDIRWYRKRQSPLTRCPIGIHSSKSNGLLGVGLVCNETYRCRNRVVSIRGQDLARG